jgi:hypothetical protein
VAGRIFAVNGRPASNPRQPFQKRRTLQARDAGGTLIWERDIAAPVYLPPRR